MADFEDLWTGKPKEYLVRKGTLGKDFREGDPLYEAHKAKVLAERREETDDRR